MRVMADARPADVKSRVGGAVAGLAAFLCASQPALAELNKYEASQTGEFNVGTALQYGGTNAEYAPEQTPRAAPRDPTPLWRRAWETHLPCASERPPENHLGRASQQGGLLQPRPTPVQLHQRQPQEGQLHQRQVAGSVLHQGHGGGH